MSSTPIGAFLFPLSTRLIRRQKDLLEQLEEKRSRSRSIEFPHHLKSLTRPHYSILSNYQSSSKPSSVRPKPSSRGTMPILSEKLDPRSQSNAMPYSTSNNSSGEFSGPAQPAWMTTTENDDWLHDPRDAKVHGSWLSNGFPVRAILNVGLLAVLAVALLLLFAGYPIIDALNRTTSTKGGSNLGGTNSSGQIPSLPDLPNLIDPETPADAMTRTGVDGKTKFKLVFSDEFNTDGRSFYPGDDPFWEAVDLWVSSRTAALALPHQAFVCSLLTFSLSLTLPLFHLLFSISVPSNSTGYVATRIQLEVILSFVLSLRSSF